MRRRHPGPVVSTRQLEHLSPHTTLYRLGDKAQTRNWRGLNSRDELEVRSQFLTELCPWCLWKPWILLVVVWWEALGRAPTQMCRGEFRLHLDGRQSQTS